MRWVGAALLALVVLGTATPARAQESDDETRRPMQFALSDLRQQYKAAQKRRNIGNVLAAPGVGMCVLGGVLIGYGTFDQNLLGGATNIISGSLVAGLGLAFTIPGLVFWTQGQERMDKSLWRWRQEGANGFPN
jgi:hypothetical protein